MPSKLTFQLFINFPTSEARLLLQNSLLTVLFMPKYLKVCLFIKSSTAIILKKPKVASPSWMCNELNKTKDSGKFYEIIFLCTHIKHTDPTWRLRTVTFIKTLKKQAAEINGTSISNNLRQTTAAEKEKNMLYKYHIR